MILETYTSRSGRSDLDPISGQTVLMVKKEIASSGTVALAYASPRLNHRNFHLFRFTVKVVPRR